MSKLFDMELFLAGVLTGSHATRQRHLRQALAIQNKIALRWKRTTPWTWQRKHLIWFIEHCLARHDEATRYYYLLTIRLLARRLDTSWTFNLRLRCDSDNDERKQPTES
ncbi:MAG: hypothetical protein ACOKSU_13320 [Pseudomonas sp.]|uniref:hypothetical protein n=1 Tax=Pseudomonas TaxID=286 RepID=UPI000A04D821|nr:hypothetical protein [Pseudomonas sp. VLB120]